MVLFFALYKSRRDSLVLLSLLVDYVQEVLAVMKMKLLLSDCRHLLIILLLRLLVLLATECSKCGKQFGLGNVV